VIRAGKIALCCVVAFIASFSLARVHPFGDAGLYKQQPAEPPLLAHAELPPQVRSLLAEKCADCHSNQTRVPIYAQFAPVSWLLERDIVQARKEMNLSQWASYPVEKQQELLAQIAHEATSRAMPPLQYRVIHWNARITDADIAELRRTIHASNAKSLDASVSGAADPVHGKLLFEKRCTGCHSLTENHRGPRLAGVYGRTSGTVPDYAYSSALKKSGIVWDDLSLDKWLTDTDAFIPGNEMDFLVAKPEDRRDVISYLRQMAGK
jgi:cytochrome c